MYRTYSSRLARILSGNGSRVWYYSMDFGTAAHVLDQAAAFDGAWKEERLFPGIPLEERRKMAEVIYETYVRFLKREILTGKEFRYGSLFVKAVKKWFGTLRSIPNR